MFSGAGRNYGGRVRFPSRPVRRRELPALSLVSLAVWLGGCAAPTMAPGAGQVSIEHSPVAEMVAPREAWRRAEVFAAERSDCEVLVGSGDSMQPLYTDRTVLVVRRVKVANLERGMTAVFVGDRGRLVAHALVERTERGWRAAGLGNEEPDRTLVRRENLVGVVVKAFQPVALVARAGDE